MPESRRFGDEENCWPLCGECHRIAPDSWQASHRKFVESIGLNVANDGSPKLNLTEKEAIRCIARSYTQNFHIVRACGWRPGEGF